MLGIRETDKVKNTEVLVNVATNEKQFYTNIARQKLAYTHMFRQKVAESMLC